MLYMAAKNFDINNVPVHAGVDIVDVSGMEPDRLRSMLDNHYLVATDKNVATVHVQQQENAETRAEESKPRTHRRVSPLAHRTRVFKSRLADKRGE